jgi:restriction endonuclease S subunit
VVPEDLDGAICSTGLAVLRPSKIDPHLLRRLLVSRYVINQMERHNVGIAYPAISEKDLVSFRLPLTKEKMALALEAAQKLGETLNAAACSIGDLDKILLQISPDLSR